VIEQIEQEWLEDFKRWHGEAKHSMMVQASFADTFAGRADVIAYKWPDVADAYLALIETGNVDNLDLIRADLFTIAVHPVKVIAESMVDFLKHMNEPVLYEVELQGILTSNIGAKKQLIKLINQMISVINEKRGGRYKKIEPYVHNSKEE